ncbi:MAG: valine--pyruvate transaminase [Gammaproteobacteria bacterium]|nr:valine--pyruvate transaminase [Gammaproteobacteria bacterium]
MQWSSFGERFTRNTGSLELMEDLGEALTAESSALFLGGGNPGKIPEIQERIQARLAAIAADAEVADRLLGNYAHPKGELRFRQALARLLGREYGWQLTAENIALTGGSQAGFFLLFNLLAGMFPDGSRKRVLLPVTPEYIGYADQGLSESLFVARQPRIEERADHLFKYRIDLDGLTVTDDIGAICVSRPTNPTGNVITDAELAALDELARAADVPFIIDNAYGQPFPGIVFVDAEPIWNENVILCMSLSKLGLPGVRTGIVVAREEIVDALMRMTAVMSLAVGSVGPVLVEDIVESGEIIEWSRNFITPFYREKAEFAVNVLKHELEGLPFRIHVAEGAFFLWLWLPGLPITSAELYERLKQDDVFVISGHHFFPGLETDWRHRNECLRISFAQSETVVADGMRMIAAEVRGAFEN